MTRSKLLVVSLLCAAVLATGMGRAQGHGRDDDRHHGWGPAYGMPCGPGQMGAPYGMHPGYGMGPGMMGPGMMGPGMMGPGMMGPGYGMGPGMMGPGMMGPGMMGPGMMGPGMMGPGMGYGMAPRGDAGSGQPLSAEDVRARLERQLAWQGNPRLKVGEVKEQSDDSIVAEIVTPDGSLVQRLEVDRRSGATRQLP